ncbi:MAG: hypothetical protein ACRD0Z_08655 [Acidimicrobiales bacterium]
MEGHGGTRGLTRSATASRTSVRVLALVGVCVLVAGGATGFKVLTAHTASPPATTIPATPCGSPEASLAATAPRHVGSWPFSLLAAGTFSSLVAPPGRPAYAIQACGAQETALRVVAVTTNRSGDTISTSALFEHDALLTSSVAVVAGSVYFGAARLDLAAGTAVPPYELTVYKLDATTLQVTARRSLGRGYGLWLYPLPASTRRSSSTALLASTGSSLVSVDTTTLKPRSIAGFDKAVAQHVATTAGSPDIAVSLYSPGLEPAATDARIEVLDVVTGKVVSQVGLQAGADAESLTIASGQLWASVGDGLSTEVQRWKMPALAPIDHGSPVTTVLEPVSLAASDSLVWMYGLGDVECAGASGSVAASDTLQPGSASSVAALAEAGRVVYLVTQSGLGTVPVPSACPAS